MDLLSAGETTLTGSSGSAEAVTTGATMWARKPAPRRLAPFRYRWPAVFAGPLLAAAPITHAAWRRQEPATAGAATTEESSETGLRCLPMHRWQLSVV